MDIFGVLIYQPIFNLIVVFYRLFSENLGLAIIAIAILSRIITIPIVVKQRKTMASAQEMNAKMKAIKEKHKNNKEQRDKEMMELQSQYLPAQLAGCLPLILQLIFFINIYNVISNLVVKGVTSFNEVAYSFVPKFNETEQLNYSFLGLFDLSKQPANFADAGAAFLPYIAIMMIIGLSQYYSMKVSMAPTAKAEDKAAEQAKAKNKAKKDSKTDGNAASEDFAEAMQRSTRQTMVMFPILYTFLSYNFPVGLSLYWIVQNSFVIIQQFVIKRLEANRAERQVKKLEAKEI